MKTLTQHIKRVQNKPEQIISAVVSEGFGDLLSEWLWETNTSGLFVFSNGRLESRLKFKSDFFIHKNFRDILSGLPTEEAYQNDGALEEIWRLKSVPVPFFEIELVFVDAQGDEIQLILSAKPYLDENGRFSGYRGVGRFERKQTAGVTDTDLLKTLMQAVENAPIGVLITDSNGIIKYTNPGFTNVTGYSSAESHGKTPRILSSGNNDKAFYKDFWSTLKQGKNWHGTVQNKRRNGEIFWCRETISPILDKDGEISSFIAMQQDVNDEILAVEALKLSEERFKGFADAASDWYWEMDEDLRFSYVSEAACENAGMKREDMLGIRRADLVTREEDKKHWKQHLENLEQRKPFKDFCYSFVRGDGQLRHWKISGRPYFDVSQKFQGYRGIGRDITESTILEEQLHQSQKMEVVGHLTGGIAHDFNNLLGIILGNAELIQESAGKDISMSALGEKAENIVDAALRGANITRQLLMFSRKQTLVPVKLRLDVEIRKIKDMLQSSVGSAIDIQIDGAMDLWSCLVDEDQLVNALLNLAINARDAMNRSGTLRIKMANTHIDKVDVTRDIAKGDYVVLSLCDSGQGMSEQTLKKVFEPFFSTKEIGKGTGLGLSMVYGFVKKSGGGIWIESKIGVGTNVQLYLPRYMDDKVNVQN